MHILDIMAKSLPEARAEISQYAPRLQTIKMGFNARQIGQINRRPKINGMFFGFLTGKHSRQAETRLLRLPIQNTKAASQTHNNVTQLPGYRNEKNNPAQECP